MAKLLYHAVAWLWLHKPCVCSAHNGKCKIHKGSVCFASSQPGVHTEMSLNLQITVCNQNLCTLHEATLLCRSSKRLAQSSRNQSLDPKGRTCTGFDPSVSAAVVPPLFKLLPRRSLLVVQRKGTWSWPIQGQRPSQGSKSIWPLTSCSYSACSPGEFSIPKYPGDRHTSELAALGNWHKRLLMM